MANRAAPPIMAPTAMAAVGAGPYAPPVLVAAAPISLVALAMLWEILLSSALALLRRAESVSVAM